MVIMSKPRLGALCLLLAVPSGLLAVSCAADTVTGDDLDRPSAQEADTTQTSTSGSESPRLDTPERPSDDGSLDDHGNGAGSELASGAQIGVPIDAVADQGETKPVEGIVTGTDSSTPVEPDQLSDAAQAKLTDFAELYLGFDYRDDEAIRIGRLRPLVSPGLLDQLSIPIPPSLREQFEAERRVTEATLLELTPLGNGVFTLAMTLSTTTTDGHFDDARLLIVTTDAAQLVSDVR